MDYIAYVKGKYMKMALKGVRIPFTEKWESAMVAAQCLFTINSNMNNNAAKLISSIPDTFEEKFEKAEPLEYNMEARKYIEILLRVQNYMRSINAVSHTYLPPLIDTILKNKASIDQGIYTYFIGIRTVQENYADSALEQAKAIENSLNASFQSNTEDIARIKRELADTFAKTQSDINTVITKFCSALDIDNTKV
jgi:transcription termination factor NusB